MANDTDILDSIRGQRVCIPDLESLLSDWPVGRSFQEASLKHHVTDRLTSVLGSGYRARKMEAARVETFAATWWPDANFEALRFASNLAIWLFLWDDDTDTPEYTSEFVNNMHTAQKFRQDTLMFVSQCLDGNLSNPLNDSSNNVINSFQPIATYVNSNVTEGQKQQLHRQLEIWITATAIEQWHEISGKLPDVDRYMQDRLGSSAVGVCLAICEHMLQIHLPDTVRFDNDMKHLWNCTNTIISIANDLLSFKKEIAQSRRDNLIVLLYLQSGSLQSAMNGALERVKEAKLEIDGAAERLATKYSESEDPELGQSVQKFVDCCKTMCTGNNTWSLASERYLLGASTFKGGIEVQL